MRKYIAAACAIVFAGCTSVSEVTQIGKDSYIVGSGAMGGIHSKAQVSQLAIKRAADFCMSQGKNLSLNHKAESGVRGWTPLESEITFQCFSDSDPAYTRLKETKDADTVIQVNK